MSQSLSNLLESIDKKIDSYRTKLSDLEYKVNKILNSPAEKMCWTPRQAEEVGTWFQAVLRAHLSKGHDSEAVRKALSEGVDSSGGYLVPKPLQEEILRIVGEVSIAEKYCRHIRMEANTLSLPTLEEGVQVGWKGEGASADETEPTLGEVKLEARKLTALTACTNELLEDSPVDVANFLRDLFSEAIGAEIDQQVFCGTGSPCSGILLTAGFSVVMPQGYTNFSSIQPVHLSQMLALLPASVKNGSIFVVHPEIAHYLRSLRDNNGNYIFPPNSNGQISAWGYPILESNAMPGMSQSQPNTPFVFLGNLRYFLIGDRLQMSVALNPFTLFDEYSTQIRVVRRVALGMGRSKAFVRLLTAST